VTDSNLTYTVIGAAGSTRASACAGSGQAGTNFTFNITVQHVGGSNSDAYDLNVTVSVPAYFQILAGSAGADLGRVSHAMDVDCERQYECDVFCAAAPLGQAYTTTFVAALTNAVLPATQNLFGSLQLVYDSYPGTFLNASYPGGPTRRAARRRR